MRETPLIAAVRSTQPAVVKLLLDKGARIEGTDRQGHTALYYAIYCPYAGAPGFESDQIMRLLLAHGASPSGKDVSNAVNYLPADDPRRLIFQQGIQKFHEHEQRH